MRFLTPRWIVDAHDEVLQRSGGESGMLAFSSLESAVARHEHGPFHGTGDIVERAAYLFRGIAQDHPFVDGNKRTAVEAAWEFLRLNGLRVQAGPQEVVAFALAAATRLAIRDIEDWLRARATRSSTRPPKEVR